MLAYAAKTKTVTRNISCIKILRGVIRFIFLRAPRAPRAKAARWWLRMRAGAHLFRAVTIKIDNGKQKGEGRARAFLRGSSGIIIIKTTTFAHIGVAWRIFGKEEEGRNKNRTEKGEGAIMPMLFPFMALPLCGDDVLSGIF